MSEIVDEYPPDDDVDLDGDDPSVPVPHAATMRKKILARSQRPQANLPKSVSKGGARILSQEKRRKALELRKGGASYVDIAQACGYADASGARKAVVKAFSEITQEPAIEVKTLQIERLNHMLMTLWPKINLGDERAIDTGLRILDKIDRLMGTEAAQTVDVNVHRQGAVLVIDGNKEDFIRSMRQMAMGMDAQGDATVDGEQKALEAGTDDVVDAEVVEEQPEEEQESEETGDEPHPVPVREQKKYKFGVDPKGGKR